MEHGRSVSAEPVRPPKQVLPAKRRRTVDRGVSMIDTLRKGAAKSGGKAMHYMNPVYIADKVNPHAKSMLRLFKPKHLPKRQVNWIKSKMTWKNMQGPLSAVAAVVLGGLCAVLSRESTSGIQLSPASVIAITTIVMEMGSTERFYVRSALRMVGTIIGAMVGFGIAAIGIAISFDGQENYLQLQIFLLCMVAVGGLITFMGMKFYEDTGYAFMMFGVNTFSIMYTGSNDWFTAINAMLSSLTGVMVSIFTILLFQFPKTDLYLAETQKIAAQNLFTIVRFAIESDPRSLDDFTECSKSVREALVATSASYEIYSQWRRWTQRAVVHDFDCLSIATRPVFYVSYSMYWSLVQSPSANPCGGMFFFCDSPQIYEKYFKTARMGIEGSMMAIESSLTRILVKDPKDTCPPQQHMDMIVSRHLWSGCVRNIHFLKEAYIDHRDVAFSSFSQNWSAVDYLHQLIALTMAITAYVHAIAETFMPAMAKHIYPMLEDICENLTQIRNEGGLHRKLNVLPSRDGSSMPSRENSSAMMFKVHSKSSIFTEESLDVDESTDLATNLASRAPLHARIPRGVQVEELSSDGSSHSDRYPGTLNRYYQQQRRNRRLASDAFGNHPKGGPH